MDVNPYLASQDPQAYQNLVVQQQQLARRQRASLVEHKGIDPRRKFLPQSALVIACRRIRLAIHPVQIHATGDHANAVVRHGLTNFAKKF